MGMILAAGHILADIRVRVDEISSSDQFNEVKELSYGVGGSAANVSIGVRRLGGCCMLLGKIGMDEFGRMAVDELLRERVPLDEVKVDLVNRTGYTIIIINRHGEVFMFGRKEAAETLEPDDIANISMKDYQAVHIASLRVDTATRIASRAKEDGAMVTFDPGRLLINRGIGHIRPVLERVDLLLLNGKEAKALTGHDDPEMAAASLIRQGAKSVAVKLGAKGVFISDGRSGKLIPAFKVDAIDTTGAGDAFAAGMIMALSEGEGLTDAIRFANAVAALKVTRLGSHEAPSRKEVEEFLSRN
ncbi:MAG: carbohydrate kinase family protein [Candidatus Methanosuratincola sp.]|nr:carbohydrate kinase family protein [Candidatus Methanosuratincola sp.]